MAFLDISQNMESCVALCIGYGEFAKPFAKNAIFFILGKSAIASAWYVLEMGNY